MRGCGRSWRGSRRNDRRGAPAGRQPPEGFCLEQNVDRAYDNAVLDIGFGGTISGPRVVGRMTSAIDVKKGEKVLEIGTGSGYR
ncbi:MAG: protein-L-isoaspartate O-methyltransferase family protein, partial [Methylovirgula sp.]